VLNPNSSDAYRDRATVIRSNIAGEFEDSSGARCERRRAAVNASTPRGQRSGPSTGLQHDAITANPNACASCRICADLQDYKNAVKYATAAGEYSVKMIGRRFAGWRAICPTDAKGRTSPRLAPDLVPASLNSNAANPPAEADKERTSTLFRVLTHFPIEHGDSFRTYANRVDQ